MIEDGVVTNVRHEEETRNVSKANQENAKSIKMAKKKRIKELWKIVNQ